MGLVTALVVVNLYHAAKATLLTPMIGTNSAILMANGGKDVTEMW